MLFEWPSFWLSLQSALLSTLLALPLAFALGWYLFQDARLALPVRLFRILPAPVLLAAALTASLPWMLAAGLLAATPALARETAQRLTLLPSPWFDSLSTLGAPAWRAAWPSLRASLLAATLWTAARLLLEALAGLLLREAIR